MGAAGRYHAGGASARDSTILNLCEDLSGFLATLGQPIKQTAREMIVFSHSDSASRRGIRTTIT